MTDSPVELRAASPYHGSAVLRRGDVVLREARPWTPSVHALLWHLEEVGFVGAPRVIGSGRDADGHEMVSYVKGDTGAVGPWSEEAAFAVGTLLRTLHRAVADFRPSQDSIWRPWFGRTLGDPQSQVISHCDVASWNLVARNGLPVAWIDWDYAGPVDPHVELVQACWLNAKLFDELVAEREGLPAVTARARTLRAIVDGYGLGRARRETLIDDLVAFAIHAAADEADQADVRFDMPLDQLAPELAWAMAWRARSASWMLRHRLDLQAELARA